MKQFARNLLPAAILAGLCCGAAMAADLSTVGRWTNKYPFDKIAGGKSLWDQPSFQRDATPWACQWQGAPASYQCLRLCRERSFRVPEEIRRGG